MRVWRIFLGLSHLAFSLAIPAGHAGDAMIDVPSRKIIDITVPDVNAGSDAASAWKTVCDIPEWPGTFAGFQEAVHELEQKMIQQSVIDPKSCYVQSKVMHGTERACISVCNDNAQSVRFSVAAIAMYAKMIASDCHKVHDSKVKGQIFSDQNVNVMIAGCYGGPGRGVANAHATY